MIMKKIMIITVLMFIFFCMRANLGAQIPPHPSQNGNGSQVSGPPVGGGTPVDGGLMILLTLGAAYKLRKLRNLPM